jgi:archaellum component FlaG (FlaF/FlaG flagellin family)
LRSKRGMVVALEIMLIIAAIIALAFVALNNIGHTLVSQAYSTKSMISIEQAQVYYYDASKLTSKNTILSASMYVTNIGDSPVTVKRVTVIIDKSCTYSASTNIKVYPGETVPLTVPSLQKHCSTTTKLPDAAPLIVSYQTDDSRTNDVNAPARLIYIGG